MLNLSFAFIMQLVGEICGSLTVAGYSNSVINQGKTQTAAGIMRHL